MKIMALYAMILSGVKRKFLPTHDVLPMCFTLAYTLRGVIESGA